MQNDADILAGMDVMQDFMTPVYRLYIPMTPWGKILVEADPTLYLDVFIKGDFLAKAVVVLTETDWEILEQNCIIRSVGSCYFVWSRSQSNLRDWFRQTFGHTEECGEILRILKWA